MTKKKLPPKPLTIRGPGRPRAPTMNPIEESRRGQHTRQLSVGFPPALYARLHAYAAAHHAGEMAPAIRALVLLGLRGR